MRRTVLRALHTVLSSRALLIGVLAAGAVAGSAFALGGGSKHVVHARFADANGLVSGNEVRVAGIVSGTVDSVGIGVDPASGAQYAEATLDIDDGHWPLHQGTTFAVRPKGVLSNVFVALNPGPRTGPTVDTAAHVFGLDQTSSPVNLDEFSNLFDPDVRTSLRTQIQEGVIAFGGGGAANLNQTIANLNPLTADLAPVTGVLAQRSPELQRLNSEFDTITRELASEDQNLRGLLENGNVFLGAIAARQTELQGTLDHAAGTLATLDQSLKGEETNLASFLRKGPAALDKTIRSSQAVQPLIAYVNPYIPHLDNLLHEFHSATGLQEVCNATAGSAGCDPNYAQTIFTLRVDGSLNDSAHATAIGCGGEPVEQRAYCPASPQPSTAPAAASGAPGTATTATTPAEPSTGDPSAAFGGLFG